MHHALPSVTFHPPSYVDTLNYILQPIFTVIKSYLCCKRKDKRSNGSIQILTDIFSLSSNGPSVLRDKFLGVEADLNNVVQERKQRSQREGGYKQGHHSELNH